MSAGVSAGASAGFSAGVSAGAGFSAGAAIGTQPLTLAQSGDSLQSLSARAGADWKAVAAANNVDTPRLLQAGAVLLGQDGRVVDRDGLVSAEHPRSSDGSVQFARAPSEFQIDLNAVPASVARIALVLTVRPALPRGTMVTFCTGSEFSHSRARTAWPAS